MKCHVLLIVTNSSILEEFSSRDLYLKQVTQHYGFLCGYSVKYELNTFYKH